MTWRGPEAEFEATGLRFPTLGLRAIEWIEEHCVIPDGDQQGDSFILTNEMARFLLHFYRVEPEGAPSKHGGPRFTFSRGGQLVRPQKWGKALALDTPVPTPSGWSTMGEMAVGDELFDEDGQVCRVVAVSPVWADADCYAVSFSDGERIVANGDHLWNVEDRQREYAEKTLDTATLFDLGVGGWADERRWRLRMPSPLDSPVADLPIDPYVLGAWLGDGESSGARLTGLDHQVFAEIAAAGYEVRQTEPKRWSVLGLRRPLRLAGLLGAKHIPAAYLRASAAQRLALLQGLMDTDGYVDDRGHCEFTTVLPALRDGVGELLSSLGIKFAECAGDATLYGRVTGPKWRLRFTVHGSMPVFRLDRKLARMRAVVDARDRYRSRHIVAIDRVESVPTVCITVNSPSSLFLVGRRMVQTHNSPFSAAVICFEADGPCVPDGWDADGAITGRPWQTPTIQVTALSEEQTDNVFRALVPMIQLGPLNERIPDTGITRINLSGGGIISPVTASARSRLGQRITLSLQDETHGWTERSAGIRLADTQRRNLSGMGGRFLETTNAWDITEGSVAQLTYENSIGVHVDYPQPIGGSVRNKVERRKAMRHAYGDSVRNGPRWKGWVDLDRIDIEVEALSKRDPAQAERFFLNRVHAGEDVVFNLEAWNAAARPDIVVADGAMISIGVDGARYNDALAIVATEIPTFHQWPLFIAVAPDNAGPDYEHDLQAADDVIAAAFDRYDVRLLYADPQKIEHLVDRWIGRYGKDVAVEWFTNQRASRKVGDAVGFYVTAVSSGDMTHDGDSTFTRHILNARRKTLTSLDDDGRPQFTLQKDRPGSRNKIDAAMAGMLSCEARRDAIAKGALNKPAARWFLGV